MNTLISFQASWCKPCQAMGPTLKTLVGKGYNAEFYDVDEDKDLCEEYNVRSVPTFIIVNAADEEVYRITGSTTLSELTKHLDNV